eukprot:761559-Hanusia_phi.AAC.4
MGYRGWSVERDMARGSILDVCFRVVRCFCTRLLRVSLDSFLIVVVEFRVQARHVAAYGRCLGRSCNIFGAAQKSSARSGGKERKGSIELASKTGERERGGEGGKEPERRGGKGSTSSKREGGRREVEAMLRAPHQQPRGSAGEEQQHGRRLPLPLSYRREDTSLRPAGRSDLLQEEESLDLGQKSLQCGRKPDCLKVGRARDRGRAEGKGQGE